MNIPTFQKKDYSYLPNAFSNLAQGAGQFQQSISRVQDIEEKERKRQQEDEYLAKVKLSREETEKVYEDVVTNAAVELREAMGLPDNESGYDRAMTEAIKIYHPITPEEWKNGTGAMRLNQQEREKLPKVLSNIRMKNWDKLYLQGGDKQRFATGMERPSGEVGVETEPGTVKKPTGTLPTSLEDVQRPAEEDSLRATVQTTLPDEMTPDQWHRIGVELDITDNPKFIERMQYLQRKEIMRKYGGQPTIPQYSESALGMPIVKDEMALVKGLRPELTEKDKIKLATDRLNALRKADNQDDRDENILKVYKERNSLAEQVIKNGTTINRLQQVLVKLKDKRALDRQERGLIQQVVSNVDDPSTYQIEAEIDRLRMENEAYKRLQQDADDMVFDMSGGFSLQEAITKIKERRKAAVKSAMTWVRTNLTYDDGMTLGYLLSKVPVTHREALKKQAQTAEDSGVLHKDIIKRIFDRK